MSLKLYSYFRSSAAYRVRIALNLKGIKYTLRPIDLLKEGGDQHQDSYLSLNPQGLIPALVIEDNVLTQSNAIIEYLEEAYPEPSLLPKKRLHRAYVRSLAQIIACDIHPLNNLRVLDYLNHETVAEAVRLQWYNHWIEEGFFAFEKLLQKNDCRGQYCSGDTPGMADVFLIPQVYNALRFNCTIQKFSLINSIYQHCSKISAFAQAAPENQTDS